MVAILSNGGFDNIYEKLPRALQLRSQLMPAFPEPGLIESPSYEARSNEPRSFETRELDPTLLESIHATEP